MADINCKNCNRVYTYNGPNSKARCPGCGHWNDVDDDIIDVEFEDASPQSSDSDDEGVAAPVELEDEGWSRRAWDWMRTAATWTWKQVLSFFAFGLKDGAVNRVDGGFRTIFRNWAVLVNLMLFISGFVLASMVGYYLAKSFGVAGYGWAAFALMAIVGLLSQVIANWHVWDKVIPQLAKDDRYFFYGDQNYTVLRGREREVVGAYDDAYRLVGNLFWKGNLLRRETPYPGKEDLSGEAKNPMLVYNGQRITTVKGVAETIDGTIGYEFMVWYDIPLNSVRNVVTGLSGIFEKSLVKTIEDTVQDALIAMRTVDARALTSKTAIFADSWLQGGSAFTLPNEVAEDIPETEKDTVRKALKDMEKRLREQIHIHVTDWGFGHLHTPDGRLEQAFQEQTVAIHEFHAAKLKGQAKREQEAPRWAAWAEQYPDDTDGRFLAAQTGANLSLTENNTRIELSQGAGDLANKLAGALSGSSGKSKPDGAKSGKGGKGGGTKSP